MPDKPIAVPTEPGPESPTPDGLSGVSRRSFIGWTGTAVVVTALSTGWVLSTAAEAGSRALAFIPNEIGAALLYNERVTR